MLGKTLNHYEISDQLGAGGMGAVYRAKDQKLGRDVAIKVLPEEFAKDVDRVARFQREAKVLASLNHPNIAAIYGLEESGGTNFLVLELVEGETLADQLKHGSIPVEESLKLALQIAEALEAAHEKGVIHRDLKPANIKVTPEGKVKVLDFGLAKAFAGEQEVNLSNSPTLSEAATMQGVILGTAAYMSPEQARGKPVDKRTDIWAFGCVLYEMLTGQAAFQGEDVTEILAAVVKSGVNLDLLPKNIHPRVREVIIRCLQKEQKKRYPGISQAQYEIEQVLVDPSGLFVQPVTATKPRKKLRVGITWVAAALVIGAIIAGMAVWSLKPTPAPELRPVTRLFHELPNHQQFGDLRERAFAVSPDGRQVVYSASGGLYLRSMNELNARLIAGTEGAEKPFFSPDGKWVGYVSAGQLKKIAITGGAPVVLTNASTTGFIDWGSDDTIVYSDLSKGIMRISANGGNPEVIVKFEKDFAVSPQVLPDGKSVLFTKVGTPPMVVMVQSLESGERKELFQGDTARYLPTGHLVYAVENDLFAIPFDLNKLEVVGGPIPMVEGVLRASGAPQYAVSDSGTLVYIPGTAAATDIKAGRALVWVDKNGKEDPLAAALNAYAYPKISPDGTKVAVTIAGQPNANIWIWDLVRKTMTRLTFDESTDFDPLWSPDGKRIAFFSVREGEAGIYWKSADGTGETELLTSAPNHMLLLSSWSGDGKTLGFTEFSSALPLRVVTRNVAAALARPILSIGKAPGAKSDIGVLSMEGKRQRKLLLQNKYFEFHPEISPDGRWMAYSSDESGQAEVYVRPFPEINGGKWQISTGGGSMPRWSPDGRQLFYRSGDAMMAVSIEAGTTFKASVEQRLFQRSYYYPDLLAGNWDISPDGKRFLMIKPSTPTNEESTEAKATKETPRKIIIVLNWFEELKQRVPTHVQ
jgi:serine/threonine protein kinase